MIELFNEMEIVKAKIDEEIKVDMVLETLSDSFKQFKLNYSMSKMVMSKKVMSLIEVIREVQIVERILKHQRNIHTITHDSSGSSSLKKKNNSKTTKNEKFKGKGKKKRKGQGKWFLYS